jgi:hypothetical protein
MGEQIHTFDALAFELEWMKRNVQHSEKCFLLVESEREIPFFPSLALSKNTSGYTYFYPVRDRRGVS